MLSRQEYLVAITTLSLDLMLPRLVAAADCNGNGVDDSIDIVTSVSNDCQPNGIPDGCEVRTLYAGTQSGAVLGQVGRVLVYRGGETWEDITPEPAWTVSAVMDLAYHNGHLYAGTQRLHGIADQGGGG